MSTAFNVTTAAQVAVPPGRNVFVWVKNMSDATVYAKFDGAPAALTTANGHPIESGEVLVIEDPTGSGLYDNAVELIHGGVGNKEVRIQNRRTGQ